MIEILGLALIVGVVYFFFKAFTQNTRQSQEPEYEFATSRHEGQRPVTTGFEEIREGYRFLATMQPSVPLWILEKHGEFNSGPESELPEYGGQQHGIWMMTAKSWEELGVPGMKEMEAPMMASAVGHIPSDGGDFLPFLKAGRRIAEGEGSVEERLAEIMALGNENPTWQGFLEKVGANMFLPKDD